MYRKKYFFLNRIKQMIIFIMQGQAETEYQTLHDGQQKGIKLKKFTEEQDLAFFLFLVKKITEINVGNIMCSCDLQ